VFDPVNAYLHGVAPVAELKGDEISHLVTKVAEIKSRT
jgi:hypothetical protein